MWLAVPKHLPSPAPCGSNTQVPNFDGNNTYCCSDKGVICKWRSRTWFQKLQQQHLVLLSQGSPLKMWATWACCRVLRHAAACFKQ